MLIGLLEYVQANLHVSTQTLLNVGLFKRLTEKGTMSMTLSTWGFLLQVGYTLLKQGTSHLSTSQKL